MRQQIVDLGERLRQQETAELLTAAPTVNLSVASANAEGTSNYFARADHSHAITTSSNPGATAAILSTTAAGCLQLLRLGVGAACGGDNQIAMADGGSIGIIGNELLTFNAAGTAVFSGVSSVQVPDGAWVGADAACSWIFDSSNGDISTLDNVGIGTTAPGGTLELHTAAGLNPSMVLSDGDVSHGRTDWLPDDAIFKFGHIHVTKGGGALIGTSDTGDTSGLQMLGIIGVADPTDTIPAVTIVGAKADGAAGIAALAAAETVLQVVTGAPGATELITVLGSGATGFGTVDPKTDVQVGSAATASLMFDATYSSINQNVWYTGAAWDSLDHGSPGAVLQLTTGNLAFRAFTAADPPVGTFVLFAQGSTGRIGMGGVTTPLAQLHIDQSGTTEAIPVQILDQADESEGFTNYIGTSAASAVGPISTWTAGNTIQGFYRIEVNGAAAWAPYYDAPTS